MEGRKKLNTMTSVKFGWMCKFYSIILIDLEMNLKVKLLNIGIQSNSAKPKSLQFLLLIHVSKNKIYDVVSVHILKDFKGI